MAAQHRHHRRVQGGQQILDGAGVVGQGRHDMGVPGVGDQGGEAFLPPPQHIGDLVLGPVQPGRLEVLRQHGQGQVEQQDQRIGLALHRLRQPLPGRAGQADGASQQRHCRRPGNAALPGGTGWLQQDGEQRGFDCPLPMGASRSPPRPAHGQQQGGDGAQQPPGAQEMEVLQRFHQVEIPED